MGTHFSEVFVRYFFYYPIFRRVFGYHIFLVWNSYIGLYVLWLARGDDGRSCHAAMGSLRATEADPVWSGLVRSGPVQSEADAGVVAVVWLAAMGALFGWIMVLCRTS